MHKEKIIKICNTVAFILALSFVVKLVRDLFVYNTTLNSAPFYIFVIVDAVQYLMPATFLFLVGRFVAYRKKKEEQNLNKS